MSEINIRGVFHGSGIERGTSDYRGRADGGVVRDEASQKTWNDSRTGCRRGRCWKNRMLGGKRKEERNICQGRRTGVGIQEKGQGNRNPKDATIGKGDAILRGYGENRGKSPG